MYVYSQQLGSVVVVIIILGGNTEVAIFFFLALDLWGNTKTYILLVGAYILFSTAIPTASVLLHFRIHIYRTFMISSTGLANKLAFFFT